MRLVHYAAEEALGHLRGSWFLALAGTAALVTALATDLGARDYHLRVAQQLRQEEQRRIDSKNNNGFVTGFSIEPAMRALRPPTPLSVLVRGLETAGATSFDFGPAGIVRGSIDTSLTQDSEVGSLLDVEAVIRLFLGLLAIVLGVETVATDRASGILTALLSEPVQRRVIATAKFVAVLAAASLASALVLVVGAVTIQIDAADLISLRFGETLLALQSASVLYLGALGACGMILGSLVRTPTKSLLAALAVWAGLALVVPQLVVFGARVLTPTPVASVIAAQRQTIFAARSLSTRDALGDTYRDVVGPGPLPRVREERPEVLAAIDRRWTAESHETREILNAIDDRARLATDTQDRLVARLANLSPGALFSEAADGLAGTGRASQSAWREVVDGYEVAMAEQLFDRPPRLVAAVPADRGREIMTIDRRPFPRATDVATLKAPTLGLSERLRAAGWALLALAVYFVVLAGSVLTAFPKLGL
jgi:ABC-type transport system involved in multi-copper enzyme maturation permease subunit